MEVVWKERNGYWNSNKKINKRNPKFQWKIKIIKLPSPMLTNYLTIAFRNIWKQKGYTIINIASISLGMVCFILILGFVLTAKSSHGNWCKRLHNSWYAFSSDRPIHGGIAFCSFSYEQPDTYFEA